MSICFCRLHACQWMCVEDNYAWSAIFKLGILKSNNRYFFHKLTYPVIIRMSRMPLIGFYRSFLNVRRKPMVVRLVTTCTSFDSLIILFVDIFLLSLCIMPNRMTDRFEMDLKNLNECINPTSSISNFTRNKCTYMYTIYNKLIDS